MNQMSRIDSHTLVYGVIGKPVGHSLGPLMHNRAFAAVGYPGIYAAFEVSDVKAAMSGIRALNIRGVSVTIPHKEAVMDSLDEIDPFAQEIGAVNTVANKDGRLFGYNSDAHGAVKALLEKTPVKDKHVAVLGAGGAARAIGFGVSREGGRVYILNRSIEKARSLAAGLQAEAHPLSHFPELSCDIVINTTSVGMHPDTEALPIPAGQLNRRMTVMDIIYNPLQTRLLKAARAAGAQTIDGVSMFVYQGAVQFELWTGMEAPVDLMKKTVHEALQ